MIPVARSSACRTVIAALGVVACCAALLAPLLAAPRAFAAGKPVITTQPLSTEVLEGETARFEAEASGEPTSVKWEESVKGGSFGPVSGATGDTLEVSNATESESGDSYRAVFENAEGSETTSEAVLTVSKPKAPEITKEPLSMEVPEGGEAVFEATASGALKPTVQWEESVDGGSTWSVLALETSTTLKLTGVKAAESGDQYQAVFTNSSGHVTTTPVTLTVTVPPKVTKQPVDQSAVEGGEAVFAAEASGTPTPTVQWYESVDGGSTWSLALEESTTLKLTGVKASENGDEYKAVFANSAGKAESQPAILTVEPKSTSAPGGSGGSSGGSGTSAGSGGGGPTAPISPGPAGRIARYLPLTMATAPLLTKGAVAFQFKYAPGRFRAAHCVQKVSGRYRCNVTWRHGNYAFSGTVEVGGLNIYNGHYTYGLRVVETNTRTHRHKTLRVAYSGSHRALQVGAGSQVRPAARRPRSAAARAGQLARWSSTRPQACIRAYSVVGPTKWKSRRLSSRASAALSGVRGGTSAQVTGGAGLGAGACARTSASSGSPAARAATVARAFATVASIFARLRTMPASPSRRATSPSS